MQLNNKSIVLAAVLLSVLAFAGCTGDNTLSQGQACAEQAEAWCATAPGANTFGFDCAETLAGDCSITRRTEIDPAAQNTCLQAIVDNEIVSCVPTACVNMWNVPATKPIHFCRV